MSPSPSHPESRREPIRLALRDGTHVLLRPIRPEDRRYLEEGLERLSVGSRLSRFFAPIAHFTEQQLDYLTNVDQDRHVAWGALDASGGGVIGLGVGRFTRLAEEPDVAEVAITVLDEAQQRGLGSLLLGLLYLSAQAHGVRVLRAIVLPDNRDLVRWLQALGGETSRIEDVLQIDLPIHPDLDGMPDTASAHTFRGVMGRLRAALDAPPQSQNEA